MSGAGRRFDDPAREGQGERAPETPIFRDAAPAGVTPLLWPTSNSGREQLATIMRSQRPGGSVATDAARDQLPTLIQHANTSSSQAPPQPALQAAAQVGLGDRSGVRIHTGADSAMASRSADARALTVGSDIHFGQGEYDPSTSAGQELLGHELTHTVQQGSTAPAAQAKATVSEPGDPAEQEADQFGTAHARAWRDLNAGATAPLTRSDVRPAASAPGTIHRSPATGSAVAPREVAHNFMGPLLPGQQRAAPSITGPLRAGERRESGDVIVNQTSVEAAHIENGDSRVLITGYANRNDEAYSYHVEPATPGIAQRVVRITATAGIGIEQKHGERGVELAVHIARVAGAAAVRGGGADGGPGLPLVRERNDTHWAHLSLDRSAISIQVIEDGGRFAYSIDPEWSGPDGSEKLVHVVATAGVRIVELDTAAEGAIGGVNMFNRKLVLDRARVQDPALVPRQGEPVDPSQFTSSQVFAGTDPFNPFGGLRAHTGRSGVTVEEPRTKARLSISAADDSIGAHFAYQILPRSQHGRLGTALENTGADIRVVAGPGTVVSITEPLPQSVTEAVPFFRPLGAESAPGDTFRESGIELHIFKVTDPTLVPPQGEAIDLDRFASVGRPSPPDHHQIIQSTEQQVDFAVADVLTSIGPGGDMADVADVNLAMSTGRDRWGNKLGSEDYGMLAVGTALPFVGAGALRGGRRLLSLANLLSHRFGRSIDEVEMMLDQVRHLSTTDRRLVEQMDSSLRSGRGIDPGDLKRLGAEFSQLDRSLDTRDLVGGLDRDTYQGVREASAFLQARGVPRARREDILQSFELETIRVRQAGDAEFAIRYHDDRKAHALGRFLFPTFPESRSSLAVKQEWNQMDRMHQWQIRPGTTIIEGRVSAVGLGLPGGGSQIYVLNPETDLIAP